MSGRDPSVPIPEDFQCPYAPPGFQACSPLICDCFVATHPDSPFDLHPEDFIVGLPLHRTEAGYPQCSTCDGGGCPDCTDPA